MNTTLDYFVQKYKIDLREPPPIQLPQIDRLAMAQTMAELGFKRGVEIGTAAGDHALLLCQNIPNLTLYCIDPWQRVDGFVSFTDQKLSEWLQRAEEQLAPYENCHLINSTSMATVDIFTKHSLDFVYIDGAHDFRHVAEDISEWIGKIRPGGILYGHDYVRIPFGKYACHVSDVVDAYARSHWITPWFILGQSEHRKDGHFKHLPSWMFIL